MDPTVLVTKQYAAMHSSLDRICGVDVRLGLALQEQDLSCPTDTRPTIPSQVSFKRLCRFVCSNFSSANKIKRSIAEEYLYFHRS